MCNNFEIYAMNLIFQHTYCVCRIACVFNSDFNLKSHEVLIIVILNRNVWPATLFKPRHIQKGIYVMQNTFTYI